MIREGEGYDALLEARCTTCHEERRHGIATREHLVAPAPRIPYRMPCPTRGDRRERDSAASRRVMDGCLSPYVREAWIRSGTDKTVVDLLYCTVVKAR